MSEDSNLLELARGEYVNAIETILNQQLEAKNITAKVVFKDSCLQIMLISKQVPDQQFMAVFICKKITNLGIKSIERLKIYGRQTGDEFPAWSQEFELAGKQPTLSSSAVDNLASHNFPKALHTTANKKNQEKKVSENKVENISSSNRTNYDVETLFPLTKKIRLSLIDENSKFTAFNTILMLVCLLYFLSLLPLLFLEWSIGVPLLFLSIGSGYLIAVLAKRKKLNSYTWFCLGFWLTLFAIPLVFFVAFFKSQAKSEAKLLAQETDKVKKTLLNPNENITFQQSASYLGGIKGHPEKTNYTGAILVLETSCAFYDNNITWKVMYERVSKVELGLFQMGETRAFWANGDVGRQLQQTKNTLELYYLDSNDTERCAKFQIHGAATIYGEATNAQQVLNHLLEFKEQFLDKTANNINSSFFKLEKLKKLKDEGVISEAEFNDKKSKFLEEI